MTEAVRLACAVDQDALRAFVLERRWFGSKSREVSAVQVVEALPLRDEEPLAALALVEVRFQPGTHEIYQVALAFGPEGEWHEDVVTVADGRVAYDGFRDPAVARGLVEAMRAGRRIESDEGAAEFCSLEGFAAAFPEVGEPRPVGAEQSNSSVVFGDDLILKAYRKVEAGVNPELELLRFLTEHEFANVPALHGWYSYSGRLMDATLGVLQAFVRGRSDGWDYALDCLRSDPEEFVRHARRLGEVTGAMHTVLACEPNDPSFCPEDPSVESLALLTASVDEQIERLFLDLPTNEVTAPIAGRGEEVRDRVRLLSHVGPLGRLIRQHGDYHLGQVLWTGSEWMVLDFEGEPARPILERRRKRSPLRDVAGMLRSFAYAAHASELAHGVAPPRAWESEVREQFLDGYAAEIDPGLLPAGQDAIDRLLSVFELEKAVYELRYELDNRPDWVHIPVAGIERLLEVSG